MDYTKPISIFKDYFSPKSGLNCSVGDFCSNVYYGDYQEEVEQIRAEKDKKARDKIKAMLPAATISGTFSERKKVGLIQHSGFIAIDIDAQDNPKVDSWASVRDKLAEVKNIFFSALSVSGNGVFLVVPIYSPKQHEKHFDALKWDFARLGYVIDKSCRDVSRLRGISYDPEGKINYEAIPYQRVYSATRSVTGSLKSPTDDLERIIDKILQSGADITNGYENWFEVGRALANEYGEGGRAYFHRLSQGFHKYKPTDCDRQFNACLKSPGRASKGTIFHLAKQYGITLQHDLP